MLFLLLQQVDYEVELAFVIGKKGKDIPVSNGGQILTEIIIVTSITIEHQLVLCDYTVIPLYYCHHWDRS